MGAWGLGSFENDDALDFVMEIVESNDLGIIEEALEEVINSADDYIEADSASRALAAGEVIAALHGHSGDIPDELEEWTTGKEVPSSEITQMAQRAVRQVMANSELRELWEESDDYDAWQENVQDLLERLIAA